MRKSVGCKESTSPDDNDTSSAVRAFVSAIEQIERNVMFLRQLRGMLKSRMESGFDPNLDFWTNQVDGRLERLLDESTKTYEKTSVARSCYERMRHGKT